jgi:hypothetical protein
VLVVVCSLALLASACGGDHADGEAWTRVHFRATDGVLLDGRLFGDGKVGVVLTHMGRPGDTQADWSSVAQTLAGKGYAVLTYNRRGVCPGGAIGCSRGSHRYDLDWKGSAKLFLSARDDIYGGGNAARGWYRWARPPKRLVLVPGSDHGTDLLRPGNPNRRVVESAIVSFLETAAPPSG